MAKKQKDADEIIDSAVKKGYKKAKSTAKKHGKLKQFYILVAVLVIIALVAGLTYYFVVIKPNINSAPPATNENTTTTGPFQFNTFANINTTGDVITNRDKLEVHFIDVGQADSALILLPDGRNMLIDAGDNNKKTEAHLTDYFNRFSITTIDYMMLTHCDSDHVGSMDFVLDNYEVKNIFMPKLYPSDNAGTEKNRYDFITSESMVGTIPTGVYYSFFTRAEDETYMENGVKKDTNLFPNVGYMEIIGEGYSMEIYCMGEDAYNRDMDTAEKRNEISPTVLLEYREKTILFTGDGCEASHDTFVNMYKQKHGTDVMDFDVYKAAHHGSGTHGSNKIDFLERINTEYAILSCEAGKYTGKNPIPHPTTIKNLQLTGNAVYRTDICGDIKVDITSAGIMQLTADSDDADTIFTVEELIAEPIAA